MTTQPIEAAPQMRQMDTAGAGTLMHVDQDNQTQRLEEGTPSPVVGQDTGV